MKKFNVKKQHHYVWANYLKRWSTNNRDVWYTTKKGKIAYDSVKSIVVESNFYQVKTLTDQHIQVIKAISSLSSSHLQKHHMSYLSYFIAVQKSEYVIKNMGINDVSIDNLFGAYKGNHLEDYYMVQEKSVLSILESLSKKNVSILNTRTSMWNFINFFAHQITRTKMFKKNIINGQRPHNPVLAELMDECWWFIGYMFGMNISSSLFFSREEDIHCLVINETGIPFITSDQPIINVHQVVVDDGKELIEDAECNFYYPISPTVAYMINKSNRFSRGIVQATEDFVNAMNIQISKNSDVYIIADNKEILETHKKYIF